MLFGSFCRSALYRSYRPFRVVLSLFGSYRPFWVVLSLQLMLEDGKGRGGAGWVRQSRASQPRQEKQGPEKAVG